MSTTHPESVKAGAFHLLVAARDPRPPPFSRSSPVRSQRLRGKGRSVQGRVLDGRSWLKRPVDRANTSQSPEEHLGFVPIKSNSLIRHNEGTPAKLGGAVEVGSCWLRGRPGIRYASAFPGEDTRKRDVRPRWTIRQKPWVTKREGHMWAGDVVLKGRGQKTLEEPLGELEQRLLQQLGRARGSFGCTASLQGLRREKPAQYSSCNLLSRLPASKPASGRRQEQQCSHPPAGHGHGHGYCYPYLLRPPLLPELDRLSKGRDLRAGGTFCFPSTGFSDFCKWSVNNIGPLSWWNVCLSHFDV